MDVCFHLVANDDDATIRRYFKANTLPQNVRVHKRTSDPAMHYATASLVLNLTRPDLCEETFGLTLLEAMSFGIPVIAPPVGGPLELVSDGQEGFLVDSRDGDLLYQRVRQLAEDEALCLRMSTAARQRAGNFSHACFVQGIREALACSGARLSDCQGRAN